MSDNGLDLTVLTQKARELNRVIRNLEDELQQTGKEAADAEAVYRSTLATTYKRLRADGRGSGEAEMLARGEVVLHSQKRDEKAHDVRVLLEKIEDRRQEKATLHALMRVVGGGS